MSTYTDASLIYYPSGYKAGKAYSLKPIPYLGSEKVVNGDFATDTDWNKGTGWTIANSKASCNGTNLSYLTQSSIISTGIYYKVQFDIVDYTSGSVKYRDNGLVSGQSFSGVGSYTDYVVAGGGQFRLMSENFIGSIDNVSVKEVLNDGDLDFTRASTATRVNEQGLIEGVRTNLVLYSEQFENAAWFKRSNIGVTANAIVSPDGTTNADKIAATNAATVDYGCFQVVASGLNTYSVFAKKAELNYLFIGKNNSFASDGVFFNLNTGAISSNPSSYSATITDYGNGWYRCSVYFAINVSYFFISPSVNGTSFVFSGQLGNGIYIWGAQLESSVQATEYIPTTTTAVSVGMLANVPRIDYTGGGCGKLLLEPQRTNLLTYSSEFDNAAWTKSGATITANSTTSPDGTTNADKLVEDAATGTHWVRQSVTAVNGKTTLSIFAKKGERDYILLRENTRGGYYFNLNTGTIGSVYSIAPDSYEIKEFSAGWYKCSITITTSNATGDFIIYTADADNSNSYTGDGTSGIYIWGAQVESGSYSTSLINTSGTAVTRVADSASKSGISSLIGQTEGTMFVDFDIDSARSTSVIAWLTDGTTNNAIIVTISSGGLLQVVVNSGGTTYVNIVGSALGEGRYKVSVAYKLNDVAVFLNGALVGTDSSVIIPLSLSRLDVGQTATATAQLGGKITSAILFKTALSNAELAALTTL